MRVIPKLACLIGLLAGCGVDRPEKPARPLAPAAPERGGASGARARSGLELLHETVRPSVTDPAIGSPDAAHQVYLSTRATQNGRLLVFLPGTHGRPANATLFLEEAARAGYHAVGLAYPNEISANQACHDDLDCYERVRREIFDGTDASREVEVSPADAIQHRLVALLSWLDARHPDQGWGAFLAGRDLRYETLALAGHSQGGGHAAYIAKIHRVARVLLFSSVCDAARGEPPTAATWVSGPHATPVERYYGFGHTADPFADKIAATWPALGMDRLGPRTPVDGAAAPYGGSHQLVTSIPQPTRKQAHSSVIGDAITPKREGVPLYRDVWRYMLGG